MDPNDPYLRALLNTMAGTESAGAYNVMYGGQRFDSFNDHPGKYFRIKNGPNKGKLSSAAGKYQFLKGTWQDQKKRLGLPDFSPQSQDIAAADLAQRTYGGDLQGALRSGDPRQISQVGRKLAGQWTSLPGGIEAGTNDSKFANAFQKHLSSLTRQPNMGAGSSSMSTPPPQMQASAPQMPSPQPQQRPHPDFGRAPQMAPPPMQGPPSQMAGMGAGLSSPPPSMPSPPPPRPPSSGFGATASAGVSPGVSAAAPAIGGGGMGGILSAIAGLGSAMGGNQQAEQAATQANDEAARRRLEWARANGFA